MWQPCPNLTRCTLYEHKNSTTGKGCTILAVCYASGSSVSLKPYFCWFCSFNRMLALSVVQTIGKIQIVDENSPFYFSPSVSLIFFCWKTIIGRSSNVGDHANFIDFYRATRLFSLNIYKIPPNYGLLLSIKRKAIYRQKGSFNFSLLSIKRKAIYR